MPARRNLPMAPILTLIAALLGCAARQVPELAREDQFDIGLGRLENQIDLFQLQGRRLGSTTSLYMRNGTFYIGNSSGAKVMEFSSYGDLLLLLFDPAQNPDPVGLSIVGEASEVASTKRAVRHSLPDIGGIAVDGEQTIYLIARSSPTLAVADAALGVRREGIILRFDREGRGLPYLGADGAGGTPFPPIESLQLTGRDELVVVSRTSGRRIVYWFSADGKPLYETVLTESQVPAPPSPASNVSTVIQNVSPDQGLPALFVMVDYFREIVDKSTGTVTAVVPLTSMLHRLDLESARFDQSYELPAVKPRKVDSEGREIEIPGSRWQFLGMIEQGYAFLMRHEGSGVYEIAMMDSRGKLAEKRRLLIDDRDLTYLAFNLSSRGILSALLCDTSAAHVVWWRCDRIVSP